MDDHHYLLWRTSREICVGVFRNTAVFGPIEEIPVVNEGVVTFIINLLENASLFFDYSNGSCELNICICPPSPFAK